MNEHPPDDCGAHDHRHSHHPHPPLAADIDGVDPISSDVLAALRKMMHLNRQVALRLSGSDTGGRFGRAGVLRMLGNHEGISQRELAEFLHLSAPTVTAMLQKMEQDGLVERWNDQADQRITRIRLAEEGRAQAVSLSDAYAEYINATVGAMPEDDRRELTRLLETLSDFTAAALKRLENPDV